MAGQGPPRVLVMPVWCVSLTGTSFPFLRTGVAVVFAHHRLIRRSRMHMLAHRQIGRTLDAGPG